MQKLLSFLLLSVFSFFAKAQIVKMTPASATATDQVEIIFDATQGTKGLVGASSVYMHTGVVTDKPDGTAWKNVVGNWGKDDGIGKMTKVEGKTDQWKITLGPSIRQYYQVADGVPIFRISMVFRNADGTKEGKGTPGNFEGGTVAGNQDIYLNLSVKNYVQLTAPSASLLFVEKDDKTKLTAQASGVAKTLNLYVDKGTGFEKIVTQNNVQTLSFDYVSLSSESLKIKAEAIFEADTQSATKDLRLQLRPSTTTVALPAGMRKGINYQEDGSKATLVLEAPKKEFVFVVGDFTNWEVKDEFAMKKTPDGELFWLELHNLTPQKEYVFQYWVDGSIKIPDPYAEKIADPWNDEFIPSEIYPNLPSYKRQDYGIASVLQTNQSPYEWAASEANWQKPDKNGLVIYELLVRDFIGSHSYKDLIDSLSYLKRLGVNAIELMPIMEFEGNESWGYNVSQFFAPDKYYGSKNDLKKFIEVAHHQGFAVILDMVLNHAFGQNPLVRMYWDAAQNKPSRDNPWFNPDATHPFNVGYDFNHESKYTQAFVDSVNHYWLQEYHFDGFRFDLSKGFTQRFNTDVGLWSNRDDSRIALLKRMANKIKAHHEDAYIILEHFAASSEEDELKAAGMMTWGNNNHDFGQLMLGNFNQGINSVSEKNRVAYMESHDEQRQMYYAKTGSVQLQSTYNPTKEPIALNRLKMLTAFFFTQPGPKMLWQFQELGYDIDINFNGRVGNKPLVWGAGSLNYYSQAERQKLYKTNAAILNLVKNNKAVFQEGQLSKSLNGAVKSLKIEHKDMDVAIVGNFDLKNVGTTFSFPHTGRWYNFFENDSLEVTAPQNLNLKPGEFYIYTSKKQQTEPDLITFFEAKDTLIVRGKIVTVSPEEFQPETPITIVFDAKEADAAGTAGLVGSDKVYMHAGIITSTENGTDWQYVKGNWGMDDGVGQMSKVAGATDKWQMTITPKNYFTSVPASAKWYRIGMVFRNADGSRQGKELGAKDIFVNFTEKQVPQVLAVQPDFNIKVYPNPVSDVLKIQSPEKIKTMRLLNAAGRVIYEKIWDSQEGQIDLSHYSSGVYLLQIEGEKRVYTKKMVIHY